MVGGQDHEGSRQSGEKDAVTTDEFYPRTNDLALDFKIV
jgi:hypothetical protein